MDGGQNLVGESEPGEPGEDEWTDRGCLSPRPPCPHSPSDLRPALAASRVKAPPADGEYHAFGSVVLAPRQIKQPLPSRDRIFGERKQEHRQGTRK